MGKLYIFLIGFLFLIPTFSSQAKVIKAGYQPTNAKNIQIYEGVSHTLGWSPQHQDISVICRSAYNWEKSRKNTPTRR